MLQQFTCAIGVAIVSVIAQHKLGQLHYVRAMAEEVAATCNKNYGKRGLRQEKVVRADGFQGTLLRDTEH